MSSWDDDGLLPRAQYQQRLQDAVAALQQGRGVIIVDDTHRENEGDLVYAAEQVSAQDVNFMATFGKGLICVAVEDHWAKQQGLDLMVPRRAQETGTAFTVSVDATEGLTTGISAQERANTINLLSKPQILPHEWTQPGHVFPLKANPLGVIARRGHTEASLDLCKLANFKPAAAICEIMNADGTMARRSDLLTFAATHQLPLLTIEDIALARWRNESLISSTSTSQLPRSNSTLCVEHFKGPRNGDQVLAIFHPDCHPARLSANQIPLVRLHSSCFTSEALGSLRCDCQEQLEKSLLRLDRGHQEAPASLLIYLFQEGRQIGLEEKLKAYALQDQGLNTLEANRQLGHPVDARSYELAYQVLKFYGINRLRLMTNNPQKVSDLELMGLVVEPQPIASTQQSFNQQYLKTKVDQMGHHAELLSSKISQIDHPMGQNLPH